MTRITLKIEGMMCGMCEAHVNDAVRKAFAVKKVTSSHAKGETVILCENPPEREALQKAIEACGYRVAAYEQRPYEKPFGFHLFGRKE